MSELDRAELAAQIVAIADAIDAFNAKHGRDPGDAELAALAEEALRTSSSVLSAMVVALKAKTHQRRSARGITGATEWQASRSTP